MPISELRLVKRWQPLVPKSKVKQIPSLGLRGIYVLYKYAKKTESYNVVYVGMAGAETRSGIRGRLNRHLRKKGDMWTHFSVFEVWDNITQAEVVELEGLFRQIYSKDSRANKLNVQKSFKKLKRVERVIPKG
ncbi:GIY-YIG nuclease family protein [Acidobacteria bacterium AH-259-A15]|nr:GIY-YIG nuclease family protein [Acidobacteria bacterium AH-259-A15]